MNRDYKFLSFFFSNTEKHFKNTCYICVVFERYYFLRIPIFNLAILELLKILKIIFHFQSMIKSTKLINVSNVFQSIYYVRDPPLSSRIRLNYSILYYRSFMMK